MKIFLTLLLFLANSLVAQDVDLEFLKSIKPKSQEEIHKQEPYAEEKKILEKDELTLDDLMFIAPTNEEIIYEENAQDFAIYQEVRVTDLLLSTSRVPKQIYQNQVFSMGFAANIQQNINLDLNLTIDSTDSLTWLNENSINWVKDINGVYRTTLWFEANATDATINKINVLANRNGEFFQKASIKPKLPKITNVEERPNYAHIVADELLVKNYKTSKFDDNSNIMTIEITAKNANLNSMWVDDPTITRQGFNPSRGNYRNQTGFYFVVFDNNKTEFNFSYFNAVDKQFENYSLGVRLEFDDLSTQVGLNPQNDPFAAYKKAAIYLGVLILLFMYVASKNSTPLIFACFLIAFNIYRQDPHYIGVVADKTKVKILPIERSTIFYITQKDEKVEIFDKEGGYYKVFFDNGKIGWVEENSINIEKNLY